eukprot:s107_g49.t1
MEPTDEVEMSVETGEIGEPDAKRARLSTMRVDAEILLHVDEEPSELLQQFADDVFPMSEYDDSAGIWDDNDRSAGKEMTKDDLWQPQSALEPVLDSVKLQQIDDYADAVEIERLLGMNVVQWRSNYSGLLGTQLSAKFVRAWRKKTRKQYDADGKLLSESPGWLRSASNVIPNSVLGTLDVADAFLQVPQPEPRVVKLGDLELVILKCLPGQRDAAKLWYQHFTNVLQKKFNATICIEQPCVLKIHGKRAMVLHVDDVLFLGDQQWIIKTFLPQLKEEFKLSSTVVE